MAKKEKMDHQHPLFMTQSMRVEIEQWRALQIERAGKMPSFSDAIRQMIDRCLVADGVRKPSDDSNS